MAKNLKKSSLANFNCTFGENNEPMLNYFDDIVLPAFTSQDYLKNDWLIFDSVKLTIIDGNFVLAGLIIKRTELEVRSRFIDGQLVSTNKVYPSDPYSYFVINLRNHRMVLTQNQKGSPTLSNFAKTARLYLRRYVNKINRDRENTDKVPNFHLNVVAIPFKGTIKEQLKKVDKIRNVILRFYPLNGDIIDNETATELLDALDKLGSNTGNLQYNTPDNKNNVAEVIEDTKGVMKPTIRAEFKNGSVGTLRDGAFAEVIQIPLRENKSVDEHFNDISEKVNNRTEFVETSEENEGIYQNNFSALEKSYDDFLKRKK